MGSIRTIIMRTSLNMQALARLLQLTSPSLPVGGYAYSQGLEAAIERDWVSNADDFEQWLGQAIRAGICCTELPLIRRLHKALVEQDATSVKYWSAVALAVRESRERYDEDLWLADAYKKVCVAMSVTLDCLEDDHQYSFLVYLSAAAVHWNIAIDDLCAAFVWQFIENQNITAMKLIPLGQTQGLVVADRLLQSMTDWVAEAAAVDDEEIGNTLPGWAMASMHHEEQYSRLYRS